jgi:hypothetical protein
MVEVDVRARDQERHDLSVGERLWSQFDRANTVFSR